MAEDGAVSDATAVERTLAGDRDAYRVLVERHSRTVYRMAYRMMGNAHDAEDVVQEAFLRAFQKLKQFAGNANFGTWVYRIAANYAIDRLRQRNSEESKREGSSRPSEDSLEVDPLSRVQDMSPSPERLAGSAQLAERMKAALNELSPAEKTAIVMRHWDGCGIEEIATVLNANSNATKNTVFRAVQKLRRALAPFLEGKEVRVMGTEG
ncbi:MAG TPA: RNA polymerase sigma factor [Candidatus Sulfotelmatobacter sp.]|nr:RNA polymerase sigma factor [Candidatus Sulfotelmatobacter sp.]